MENGAKSAKNMLENGAKTVKNTRAYALAVSNAVAVAKYIAGTAGKPDTSTGASVKSNDKTEGGQSNE